MGDNRVSLRISQMLPGPRERCALAKLIHQTGPGNRHLKRRGGKIEGPCVVLGERDSLPVVTVFKMRKVEDL